MKFLSEWGENKPLFNTNFLLANSTITLLGLFHMKPNKTLTILAHMWLDEWVGKKNFSKWVVWAVIQTRCFGKHGLYNDSDHAISNNMLDILYDTFQIQWLMKSNPAIQKNLIFIII